MTVDVEFKEFPKIARLSREMTVSEKIDGTNGCILITDDGQFFVGSRSRWITPEDDNFGFARWACDHKEELMGLGPGRHFGEWWGQGIQRKYGLTEKRWSLFNTSRWASHDYLPEQIPTGDPNVVKMQQHPPDCCHVVPVLYRGPFDTGVIDVAIQRLREEGSHAAPGFMKPEGVIVYHAAGNVFFKKTILHDDAPKTIAQGAK